MNNPSNPDYLDIAAQAVRTLTLYSLAEFQSGYASTIHVSSTATAFSVGDDGRGHAVDRIVAGSPYLQFIYSQFDYPFAATEGGPVQLQGIGMSLLNTLCSELVVTVRKTDKTVRMTYKAGRLCQTESLEGPTESTGNTVSGTISPALQREATNVERIEQWLVGVLATNPTLKLYFNGRDLHASQPGAES